jgi:hypothetical protein
MRATTRTLVLTAITGSALFLAPAAYAATGPGVGMSLGQTSVSLPAGASVAIPVQVWTTGPDETATTSVTGSFISVPSNRINLSGGVNAATKATVTVSVPSDAANGIYTDTVKAQVNVNPAGGITLSPGVAMTLRITVAPVSLGQAVTPGNIVPVNATANWGAKNALYAVRNTGNVAATIAMSSPSAMVSITGNGAVVQPGQIGYVRVTVTAPWGIPAGVYSTTITSTLTAYGQNVSQDLPLTITVLGN